MTTKKLIKELRDNCSSVKNPPKHGHWIDKIEEKKEWLGRYECSCCGTRVDQDWYNYCPFCGAKMNEEAAERTNEEWTNEELIKSARAHLKPCEIGEVEEVFDCEGCCMSDIPVAICIDTLIRMLSYRLEEEEKKKIPKKPVRKHLNYYCPECDTWLLWDDAEPNDNDLFCPHCGTPIDWSVDDDCE